MRRACASVSVCIHVSVCVSVYYVLTCASVHSADVYTESNILHKLYMNINTSRKCKNTDCRVPKVSLLSAKNKCAIVNVNLPLWEGINRYQKCTDCVLTKCRACLLYTSRCV